MRLGDVVLRGPHSTALMGREAQRVGAIEHTCQPMFLAFWTHSQLLSPQPCGSLVESVCHQLAQAACLIGIEPLRAACPITQAHDEEHGQENRERCGEHQSSLSSSASSPKHKIVSNEVRYITKAHYPLTRLRLVAQGVV